MDDKENALGIIRFDHPERVVSAPPVHEIPHYGCNHEGFQGGGDDNPVGSEWLDIWGTQWHKEHEGVMGLPKGNPLSEVGNLAQYRWPDPNDPRICEQIYALADAFTGGDQFLTGVNRDLLWEKAYMLVGMEDMMAYFLQEPEYVKEVLHRIMNFQLGIAEHYIGLGVEMVKMGDDLGAQQGPLLGPRIVNEYLLPEYERIFRLYKENDVLIWFHSCGNVESLVETFMQLGVDILHPVQATANDLDKVRSLTHGKMALHGGVNSATVMKGPVDRIAEEARERIWQLGQHGGYFCSPDQTLPYPRAHVEALHETIDVYGRYPLRPNPIT
jgi:uroporphyrinogen decarboxylase